MSWSNNLYRMTDIGKDLDVFISYSRKDYKNENGILIEGNVITELKACFEKNSITYWIDEEGIYSGQAFAKVIARNIKKCKILIFVSSVKSNKSPWTSGEIATAVEYKKTIIPLRIDDSVYQEDIMIYLAKLDYIDYYANKEKGMRCLVDSILVYKKELEDERLAAWKIQQERERIERLEDEKRKCLIMEEKERKDQERLAAIALEKKRREEELSMVLNQILELEKSENELADKCDEIDKEKKKIERERALIHKQLVHLETRQRTLEMQIVGNNITTSQRINVEHNVIRDIFAIKKMGLYSLFNKIKNILFRNRVFKISVIIFLSLIGVPLLFFGIWLKWDEYKYSSRIPSSEQIPVASDLDSAKHDDVDTIAILVKPDSIVPSDVDSVYGISIPKDIIELQNLNIRLSKNDNKLHKITFAIMKCTGKGEVVDESYEYIRSLTSENGIYFGSIHYLDVKNDESGVQQANNFISRVGILGMRDLPPILELPLFTLNDASVVKQRCVEWINTITEYYGVKPILRVGKKEYYAFVKNWDLNVDNIFFNVREIPKEDKVKFRLLTFNSRLYNDTIPQNRGDKLLPTFIYKGTYEDFIKQFGE